jgi:hypothetical protein
MFLTCNIEECVKKKSLPDSREFEYEIKIQLECLSDLTIFAACSLLSEKRAM